MNEKLSIKLPKYYGFFIVLALLPQAVGLNGTLFENVFKFLLVGILLFRIEPVYVNLSIFSVCFIFGLVVNTFGTIVLNGSGMLTECLNCAISIMLLFLLVEPVRKNTRISQEDILVFYEIFIYFMLVASFYNMIVHFDSLMDMSALKVYNTDHISSFFDNKNTYGVFLMFGVLASTILKITTQQKKWMVFSVIFFINEVMAMCRTAVILSFALIVFSFYFKSKNNSRKNILSVIFLIVVAVLVFKNERINHFVFNSMFYSTESLDVRSEYVEKLLPLVKGEHFWFGYGSSKALELANLYTGNAYYHNGFLKALMVGGVFKLALQISAILLSLYYGFKNMRLNKQVGALCVLSTILYVIYNFVEAVILFDTPVVSLTVVLFVITLPIMFNNALIKGESENLI